MKCPGLRVLLIDDDRVQLKMVSDLLRRIGHTCVAVADGRAGLRCLVGHPEIDVVLCDVIMPDMDGYQVLRCIRETHGSGVPVALMSATESQQSMQVETKFAANQYISKPVGLNDLRMLHALVKNE